MDSMHKIVTDAGYIRLSKICSDAALAYKSKIPGGYTSIREPGELEYTVYISKDYYHEFINKTWPDIVSIMAIEYKELRGKVPDVIEVDGTLASNVNTKIRDVSIILHNKLYIDIKDIDIVDDYNTEMNIIKVHS